MTEHVVYDDQVGRVLEGASREHWQRAGTRQRLGIILPLFSARTASSQGIGDFADLERLVDWCERIGATALQLLPLNDAGNGTSPYSALSAMALDPAYISLERLAPMVDDAGWLAQVRLLARVLEQTQRVQYAAVRRAKEEMLRQAFERCSGELRQTEGYQRFREESSSWLDGYATFRVLKERNGWAGWEEWGAGRPSEEWISQLKREAQQELDFHCFQQWLAREQLMAAKAYADERGVLLKGDIPILVGRDSADVWQRPELFDLNATAGAPPDMYAADGQNWGFPTYVWATHEGEGFAWWRQRLELLQDYYHLYRIDHVVGFFRIWTIPLGERTGRNGRFVPEDESRWDEHGRNLLEMMLSGCNLLPLAEDLGTIPDVCRSTLLDMGIPGLKVARWEKRYHGDGSFVRPWDYPWLSVATSSTHDSETLAGWWQAFPGERSQLHRELGLGEHAPEELTPELAERLLSELARARSAFTLLPMGDILAPSGRYLDPDPTANRVNVPGICNETNWTYRLPFPLERLLDDGPLNDHLRKLLARPNGV